MARSAGALLLGGLLALTAGCSVGPDTTTVDAPAAPPARVHPRWPGCAALGAFAQPTVGNTVTGSGLVPAGFRATTAILCQTGRRTLADRTEVEVDLERRATSIEPLLTYLARPSLQARDPQKLVCPAMGWTAPWLFLSDHAGRWITPRLPTDPCGYPLDTFKDPVRPTYLDLHYRDVVVHQKRPR